MDGNLTPTQKGNIAETAIVAAAYRLGIHVSRPLGEGQRYDLVFDWGDRLERIQCKWARRKGDVLVVHLSGCRHTPAGYVRRVYRQHEIDAVVAFSPDLGRCYHLPLALVANASALRLRLDRARNNQVERIHFASQYELGAVAQLGERRHGMAEVRGSSPLSSTSPQAVLPGGLSSL